MSLALIAADSSADPTSADHRIGDGPDDVITVQAYECVSETGQLFYVADAIPDPTRGGCWHIEIRRPYLTPDNF